MRINIDNIIKDSDPLIREHSKEVKLPLSKMDESLIKRMYQYVHDSHDEESCEKYNLKPAVGIAGVQAGKLKKMIAVCVDFQDGTEEYALINPKIISNSVQQAYLKTGEGCLSVPEEHQGYVMRSARITVTGYDWLTKQDVRLRFKGYMAIIMQHEIDHLSGILFYDHINKNDPFYIPEDAIEIE